MKNNQPLADFDEIRLVENLLSHVIPKYHEAHDIMTSLLDVQASQESRIVDLGCGFGDLTRRIVNTLPLAIVFGLDNQSAVLERTRDKFRDVTDQAVFFERDLNSSAWNHDLDELTAVVSSFALDYLPQERHKEIIREAFEKLVSGGRWVSCEFFRSEDARINRVFHDLEVSFIRGALKKGSISSEQLEQLGSSTILRQTHHICTVAEKMQWLTQAGFTRVDAPWRFLNLAVISGVRD